MKEISNLAQRSIKWRFKNPVTIVMTMIQPLMWLLLFANLFNANDSNFMSFILAGILVMAILFSSGMSGIANYSLKENGSYYRVMISPTSRKSIVIAHIVDAIVLSGIQILVLLLISFLFGVRIQSGLLGTLCIVILLLVMVAFVSTISYLLSLVIPDENGFIAIINTFTLPLFFLSTALVKKESLSSLFQILVSINPFTYVINSLRNLITEQTIDWQLYKLSIIVMLILATLCIYTTIKKLRLCNNS
ncbi:MULTISPECIES: ABC transporter permease [unclassified Breznakia]|uniref:ABC transporter permease n=1 Tax=unclassified Breznakia TaxID=2623764 RepID=UPI002475C490|nr:MULTISPECIES: ABC transporter permease [unclassified Breznakia]MDH6367419.1 ABC-2 type transport system permease protein [Breznakia sp. PH1-1]MDH6403951.1 ABC-2 type transport system permease protein [Breznakia sp. PF1-11]MDH6411660.1 ABC-2 type transport system permease protein [Breznakia sp. PFB1-11]MDH6414586.1 ABC-2 type transport system permease protein [Breznakia sp. PFB1-14]MDH6416011.1 ABC-2 type transport system permease protein [Breznakia sp. PFB1-4]